jgi:outer membrane protein insertion porin family
MKPPVTSRQSPASATILLATGDWRLPFRLLKKGTIRGKCRNIFAMVLCLFLIAALAAGASSVSATPTVRSIIVEGNSRIPADTIRRWLSITPNSDFNPLKVQEDLRKLHDLGFFMDVQMQSREAGDGTVDVVCRVRESPFISGFSIEGVDSKLEEQIHDQLKKEKLELPPGTPFKPAAANKAALAARNFLRSRKYPNAEIQIATEKRGDAVRVLFNVTQGQRLEVRTVRFTGNQSIPAGELLRQMQYARPVHFWARWGGASRYIPEELYSDLQRIKLYYKSRGFAAVSVGEPQVHTTSVDSRQRIEIEIPIVEGAQYRLSSARAEGHMRAGAAEVNQIVAALHTPGDYDYSLLDSTRQKIVDTLGHHGHGLARVALEQYPDEADRTVKAVYKVDAGNPIAIGRIQLRGNYRIPDKFLRRELRIREGEVFDTAKLDQSVERLNKGNLLQEVRRTDVSLNLNKENHLLDVTVNVREKDRQGIYATGGTGGISGGYLGLLYTAFNFLRLGETLSLELDGGAAQSNMLLNIVGTRFLGSPFTLALSVFNRYAGFNVANVVPGPESLVQALKKRSRGVGLSGAYPVTGNLSVGMGFETERDSITGVSTSTKALRSEVAPFVLFDRTRDAGTRGYRLSYSQAWDGSLFLKSLDSTRKTVQVTRYAGDPWTKGRNSFAFHLQGSWVRASGGGPLFLERRFYPGDESVRGFSRGSLSPWMSVPGSSGLQPGGADTVLGFSAEYRVPIRGALSSVGFFDIGWTHLNPKDAAQLGTGARVIDETNGVLRASAGGELRLQLPRLHQPARMIFSWNPLRLAEPKSSLRFALGTLY